MNLRDCHNFEDFRKLAKKKLPSPIFHYIDGGSDDEVTLKRNTESFNSCDLIPNVLSDVSNIDLSTSVFGKKIDFPLFCHQHLCTAFIITAENVRQQKLQKKWVPCLAYRQWQQLALRKLAS